MKRLNNILSFLWSLLLLLTLTTCSDWEEIVVAMQGEEEVELTIPTNVPSLGSGTTRIAPTENVTSITALAFDGDHELIKVVKENVVQTIETDSTGTFKVKVPKRTRRIHFIAKNNGDFDEITDDYYGQTDVELLVDRTSSVATDDDLRNNALHYWAMLDFENADDLNDLTDELASASNKDGKLTLIRNMAKLILDTKSNEDYIAGFLNYNTNGTLVPYFENGEGVEFRYQTETNHDLPKSFLIRSDEVDRHLGKVHYLFEEFNDAGDLVYVICKISGLFYKFAFKPSADAYYYIVRNCAYRIKVDGEINEDYGKETYEDAVLNASPINDTALEQVHFDFNPNPLSLFLGESGTVTVSIPPGITELQVGYSKGYFDQGGVACGLTPTGRTEVTIESTTIWVDTYDVSDISGQEISFTINLKDALEQGGEAISGIEIQFQGSGAGKMANDILSVNALLRGDLTVTPTTVEMVNRVGNECTITVTIPSYVEDVGNFRLHVSDANGLFDVTAPGGLDLHDDGYYYVTEGQQYTFTFALTKAGNEGDTKEINFDLFTDYHHLEGTTTVTLTVEEVDLDIAPATILNTAGSTTTVTVPIPLGITALTVDAGEAFAVTSVDDGVTKNNAGTWDVSNKQEQNVTFTLTLNKDGEVGTVHNVTFSGSCDYKRVTGSTTVTLQQETKDITAVPSVYSLNYAGSSVEDLLVNVTIPKEVSTLTFASDYFDVAMVGSVLTATANVGEYTVAHADDGNPSTSTIIRLRLKNKTQTSQAGFTISGTGNNVTVTPAVINNITLSQSGDANVRWQGSVPLNSADYATIVPLKYEWFHDGNNFIPAGSKLNLEFNVTGGDTSWLEVFEIRGDTESNWNNPVLGFADLNNGRYTATGNGNVSLSLTITDAVLSTIAANYRDNFLGEGTIAMAIRGEGITLTKVSVVPDEPEELQTVAITATPQTSLQTTSLGYSANSVSDLIVNVTIPAGVTTLEFSSEYFDVGVVNDEHLNDNGDGTYTRIDNNQVSTYVRLRLKNKTPTQNAGFTFSGTGNGLNVIPATVNNITLQANGDEYVRWQGDVLLNWNANGPAPQIPLPYSWFEGLSPGSKLRVEYEVTDADKSENDRNAVIQFTEVKSDSWTEYSYFFEELRASGNNDNDDMGLNLSKLSATNIYTKNYVELNLTETILTQMNEYKVTLQGLENVSMAIQGGNVRLKKISVIPNNQSSGEVVLHSGTHTFTSWENDALIINREFPVGTVITINFSSGGTIKLCDLNSRMLYVPTFADQYGYPGADNNNNSYDLYMGVNQGNLVLEIVDGITLREWQTGTILATISNSYPLNGLRIESGDAVLKSVVAVFP